ncbi:MAG: hypothetical protein R3D78_05960 [Paracoccaceae bacterium]
MGKLIADWMTDGRTHIDHNRIDYSRFSDFQLEEDFIWGRCEETAAKIYNLPKVPARAFGNGRGIRRSPFMSARLSWAVTSWNSAAGSARMAYAANEHSLRNTPIRFRSVKTRTTATLARVERRATGDERGLRDHQPVALPYDRHRGPRSRGADGISLRGKVGGDNNIGKGIYTHMLDDEGNVRADFTLFRMEDRCRLRTVPMPARATRSTCSAWRRRHGSGRHHHRRDRKTSPPSASGGPNARENLEKGGRGPGDAGKRELPFAAIKTIEIAGKKVSASALLTSANRAGSCTCATRTALPSGTRCAARA